MDIGLEWYDPTGRKMFSTENLIVKISEFIVGLPYDVPYREATFTLPLDVTPGLPTDRYFILKELVQSVEIDPTIRQWGRSGSDVISVVGDKMTVPLGFHRDSPSGPRYAGGSIRVGWIE